MPTLQSTQKKSTMPPEATTTPAHGDVLHGASVPGKAVLVIVLACLTMAACSRLTFVRPKLGPGKLTESAPEYTLRADPQDQKRVLAIERIGLAGQYLRAGKLDEAEQQAQAALKADPGSVDAYTLLAVIADQRGQSTQAGTLYAKAATMAPDSGAVLNNYGTWLCSNGRSAESLAYFDRALADRRYASPAAALANAGACALTAGQGARAEQNLRRAEQMDPDNPVVLAALARVSYNSGQYMDARAFSERRLAAAPASPEVLLLASQIEQKLGDTAAAARYVQRIRTEFPQAGATPSGDAGRR